MSETTLARLTSLADQIAREVVFAEPGKDSGLLPLNCLLASMEELVASNPPPQPISLAFSCARRWLTELFDGNGLFTERMLKRFGEWTVWTEDALRAWADQTTIPLLPVGWETVPSSDETQGTSNVGPDCVVEQEAIHLNVAQDRELLREFTNESQEHLQNIEQGLLALESNPSDPDALNSIFRAFHTLKGGAGFLHLGPIQRLAHELESLLDSIRQGTLALTQSVTNLVLEGGDTLRQFITRIEAQLNGKLPEASIVVPTQELLLRAQAILRSTGGPPGAGLGQARASQKKQIGVDADCTAAPSRAATSLSTAIKVDPAKLDALVDLVGELVISQSLVVQNSDVSMLHNQQLNRDLAQLGRITKELQRAAMSLRMVPIRSTFQKMQRLVRDLSAKVSKPVRLVVEGEETELDRTIVEQLGDPLVHMIRNAVDHGIEPPELRRERGKAAEGTIHLKAFYQGGSFLLQISDDGSGLNKQRIIEKATERGLLTGSEELTDNQIFSLIFAPGFSTAEQITDLSGRGVGLDVVRRNIERLRGKIDVQSAFGSGSCFSISLPLTLAIIDGLIVGVGEHRYVLPTLSVLESFRPDRQMVNTMNERGEIVSVRGRLRPLLRLSKHLNVRPNSTNPEDGIVVIVQAGNDVRCVLVDQLLGKQEVVIKSLGEAFRDQRALAGAAILGDGRVGLILDPHSLVHLEPTSVAEAA